MAIEKTATGSPVRACPPVLMIWFNRPALAAQVLERVRMARPARLYIAVDGARDATRHPKDAGLIRQCQELAATVDWPCEVKTRFSAENQGCGRGPSNAISWFFAQEENGIVLEDDCVPDESFFPFCAEILERYAADESVMHINGNNFAPENPRAIYGDSSFGFCRYAQAWGWASWARAWQHFDYDVAGIRTEGPEVFRVAGIDRHRQEAHRERVLSTLGEHHHDVWDYQWQYAVLKRGGLCVSPAVNLISNLGFGDDATHTKDPGSIVAYANTGRMRFPLKPPAEHKESEEVNRLYAGKMLGDAARYRKKALKRWIRGLFGINKAAR